MPHENALFADNGMNEMAFNKMKQMRVAIDAHTSQALLNTDMDELCQNFLANYRLTPLTLYPEKTTTSQVETQVDVRNLPDAFMFDRTGSSSVPGTRFTFHVPFDGDSDLFKYRPSTYWTVYPHGRVQGGKVLLDFESRQPDASQLRAQYDKAMEMLKNYVDSQHKDVEAFNRELEMDARKHIQTRRERLLQGQQVGNALGFPQEPR